MNNLHVVPIMMVCDLIDPIVSALTIICQCITHKSRDQAQLILQLLHLGLQVPLQFGICHGYNRLTALKGGV